jgi:DNA-binding response OmpR family regulator
VAEKLCASLRRRDSSSRTRIRHKLRALQAGAKDFISKPFDLVEIKTRIHNMLEVRLLYKKLENYNKVVEQTVQERTAELRESEHVTRSWRTRSAASASIARHP